MTYLKDNKYINHFFGVMCFFALCLSISGGLFSLAYAENQCAATYDACAAQRDEVSGWIDFVKVEYAGEFVDGDIPVSELSELDVLINECQISGDINDYCFAYDQEVVDIIENDLSVQSPLESLVDTSLVITRTIDNQRCFFGSSSEASSACEQESQRLGSRIGCVLDQSLSSDENIAYCADMPTFGTGLECSDAAYATLGSENASSRSRALSECLVMREYYETGSQVVPACSDTDVIDGESVSYRMCFDASGLSQISDREAAILEEANRERISAALIAEREARAEERRIQNEVDRSNLREAGALVPCINGCTWNDLIQLANNVINFVIWSAAIFMVLAILAAGFRLVTAQGNPGALAKEKGAILKAVVGLCIVLLAWLLVSTFMSSLLNDDFQSDDIVNLLEEE